MSSFQGADKCTDNTQGTPSCNFDRTQCSWTFHDGNNGTRAADHEQIGRDWQLPGTDTNGRLMAQTSFYINGL